LPVAMKRTLERSKGPEVVVGEGVVLLRVEDLEEPAVGRRGSRARPCDLVEHEDAGSGSRRCASLDDPSRERADVGCAGGPRILRLVPASPEAHPDEIAPQRTRDWERPSEVFPTPGGR